jgi:hypothetical protein
MEVSSYADTKKAVELLKESASFKEEALCLEHVSGHLGEGVTGLLRQVSKWQEANIQMDGGIVLEELGTEECGIVDMRMVVEVCLLLPSFLYSPDPTQQAIC